MKDKLNSCINLLTKAKEIVSSEDPNIELAIEMLTKGQDILSEFSEIEDSEKKQYKEELIQIQALGKIINMKLAKEKKQLQEKVLLNKKMTMAVKGYSRG